MQFTILTYGAITDAGMSATPGCNQATEPRHYGLYHEHVLAPSYCDGNLAVCIDKSVYGTPETKHIWDIADNDMALVIIT